MRIAMANDYERPTDKRNSNNDNSKEYFWKNNSSDIIIHVT